MGDYIDRNVAIEALRKFAEDCPDSTEAATAVAMGISVLSRVQSAWIDVGDRRPETSGLYLCVHMFVIKGALRFTDKPVSVLYYDSDEDRFQNEGVFGMKVTYWMPLPDVPKGGANNG